MLWNSSTKRVSHGLKNSHSCIDHNFVLNFHLTSPSRPKLLNNHHKDIYIIFIKILINQHRSSHTLHSIDNPTSPLTNFYAPFNGSEIDSKKIFISVSFFSFIWLFKLINFSHDSKNRIFISSFMLILVFSFTLPLTSFLFMFCMNNKMLRFGKK